MSAAIPSRRSLAPAIALAAALVAGCGASGPATALPSGDFFFRGPHALPTQGIADAFGCIKNFRFEMKTTL